MLIGLVAIFIAVFMLFFIFDSLEKLSKKCQEGLQTPICSQLSSFTMSMLVVLLVVSGFVIIICVSVYIMISA